MLCFVSIRSDIMPLFLPSIRAMLSSCLALPFSSTLSHEPGAFHSASKLGAVQTSTATLRSSTFRIHTLTVLPQLLDAVRLFHLVQYIFPAK